MKMIKKLKEKNKHNHYLYLFHCPYCGKAVKNQLSNGKRDKSCGCRFTPDGFVKDNKRLYQTWTNMKTRCLNKKYAKWHRYGGRGIKICEEWKKFINFCKWAKENGYQDSLQIDRINNDGNYEPENCRFITLIQNHRNSSVVKINENIALEIKERKKTETLSDESLSKIYHLSRRQIYNIVHGCQWIIKKRI